MNKNFKAYALIWAILLTMVNLVIFLARPIIPGYIITYDARFWIAWGLILIAFIVNLVSTYIAFKDENPKKLFYNISIIRISYVGVVLMCIASAVVMLIPDCPVWIAGIVCVVIAIGNAIAIIKARWAVKIVSGVDKRIERQTTFIRSLTIEAESLMAAAKTPEIKALCRKVYEAARYSNLRSSDALVEIEGQIRKKFNIFSEAVYAVDAERVEEQAEELIKLIGDRNRRSKISQ